MTHLCLATTRREERNKGERRKNDGKPDTWIHLDRWICRMCVCVSEKERQREREKERVGGRKWFDSIIHNCHIKEKMC